MRVRVSDHTHVRTHARPHAPSTHARALSLSLARPCTSFLLSFFAPHTSSPVCFHRQGSLWPGSPGKMEGGRDVRSRTRARLHWPVARRGVSGTHTPLQARRPIQTLAHPHPLPHHTPTHPGHPSITKTHPRPRPCPCPRPRPRPHAHERPPAPSPPPPLPPHRWPGGWALLFFVCQAIPALRILAKRHESRSLLRLPILTTLVDAKATLDPFLASPAGSTVPAPRPSNLRIAQDRGRLKWDGTGRSVGQAPRVRSVS